MIGIKSDAVAAANSTFGFLTLTEKKNSNHFSTKPCINNFHWAFSILNDRSKQKCCVYENVRWRKKRADITNYSIETRSIIIASIANIDQWLWANVHKEIVSPHKKLFE